MHIQSLDTEGLLFIKSYEGFSLQPYIDSAGIATIGYGSTYYEDGTRVQMTDPHITQQRAENLLAHCLRQYELAVDSYTRDDINQHQFNALTSFCYNEGAAKLKGSHLLQKINSNPADPEIKDEFGKWVYAGGKKINGLITRRKAEADMYFSQTTL